MPSPRSHDTPSPSSIVRSADLEERLTAIPAAGTAAEAIPDPDEDLRTQLQHDSHRQEEQPSSISPSASHNIDDIELQRRTDEVTTSSSATAAATPAAANAIFDIEHQPVHDDPRLWSAGRKWGIVAIVSYGALVPALSANVFFPSIDDLERELGATSTTISLALAIFILCQGLPPLLWSPISELIGRKPVFLIALSTFSIASGFVSLSKNMTTLIVLRAISAAGSSAALSIAAGTLADLYEAEERGVIVGIYYSAPITGPAIAPIIGGALTEAAGWKAPFWFLGAAGAVSCIGYALFKETFRTQRSAAWQKARQDALKKIKEQAERGEHLTPITKVDEGETGGLAASNEKAGRQVTFVDRVKKGLHLQRSASQQDEKEVKAGANEHKPLEAPEYLSPTAAKTGPSTLARTRSRRPGLATAGSTSAVAGARLIRTRTGEEIRFKPTWKDVSPLGSAVAVLQKPHNWAALLYSGIAFSAQYSLSYTATQTFTAPPYNYSPILIGCVLLSLGVGGMAGSIIGGRLSDLRLRRVMKQTGSKAEPEERLRTIFLPMVLVIPAFIGYGWAAQYHVNISVPIILLFIIGYTSIHCYSVDLAYLVDSNPGRSSGAVAVNSAFRGFLAFIAAEVSDPILSAVGNGPFQTGWAVLIACTVVFLWTTAEKGKGWRGEEWKWPRVWKREQWKRGRVGGSQWVREKKERESGESKRPREGEE